jgi:hypothetical protein
MLRKTILLLLLFLLQWQFLSVLAEFSCMPPLIAHQNFPTLIDDCYGALRNLECHLAKQQEGLFRDLRNRQLRVPTRPDRTVNLDSFQSVYLPARFTSGSCVLAVRYTNFFLNRLQPLNPKTKLNISQYIDNWRLVKSGIEWVLAECLEKQHAMGAGVLRVGSNAEVFDLLVYIAVREPVQ